MLPINSLVDAQAELVSQEAELKALRRHVTELYLLLGATVVMHVLVLGLQFYAVFVR